ncbi:hypothetical protein BHM03_00026194 [Ensete ventricosum]|uniref:Uncharacterized protein n=1 Tax=Ensete ventricosum TaxID=4639 RepID=A0A445MH78_ENSVE|nr:hypothetical protein BHM03_00026194 [Ensete ventricosum]
MTSLSVVAFASSLVSRGHLARKRSSHLCVAIWPVGGRCARRRHLRWLRYYMRPGRRWLLAVGGHPNRLLAASGRSCRGLSHEQP